MSKGIESIYLVGFRTTGKSTVGRIVGQNLAWPLVDTDAEVEKSYGITIAELTGNGTNWQPFRSAEHQQFLNLQHRRRIVVDTGGGLPVNDCMDTLTDLTFGEQNAALLRNMSDSLVVLLTANDQTIARRMRRTMDRQGVNLRPPLDPELARRIAGLPIAQQMEEIIADSLHVNAARRPLYDALSAGLVIDTSYQRPRVIADRIVGVAKGYQ